MYDVVFREVIYQRYFYEDLYGFYLCSFKLAVGNCLFRENSRRHCKLNSNTNRQGVKTSTGFVLKFRTMSSGHPINVKHEVRAEFENFTSIFVDNKRNLGIDLALKKKKN